MMSANMLRTDAEQVRERIAYYASRYAPFITDMVMEAELNGLHLEANKMRSDSVGFSQTLARQTVERQSQFEQRIYERTIEDWGWIPRRAQQPNRGADFWDIPKVQHAGRAQLAGDGSGDPPMVAFGLSENRIPLVAAWLGYFQSWMAEIRAAFTGNNERGELMTAVERGHAEFTRDYMLFGNTTTGIPGALNHFAATVLTAPTGAWTVATADQIIADTIAARTEIRTGTASTFRANALLLPTAQYETLDRPRGGGEQQSIREFIERNLGVRTIEVTALDTAGPGGSPRGILTQIDERIFGYIQPVPIEARPPDVTSMGTKAVWWQKIGGFVLLQPRAYVYLDGI